MFKCHKRPVRTGRWVGLACAMFVGTWSLHSTAGSVSSSFKVSVTLIPAPAPAQPANPATPPKPVISPPGLPVSAFCTKNNIPSAHGAVVTVVCSTGVVVEIEPGSHAGHPYTPMHGGAYRYVTHVTPNGALADTVDAFGGAGTTTAWRVVHLTGRDYLEMTLGW